MMDTTTKNEDNAKKFSYDWRTLSPIEHYKTICCLFKDMLGWEKWSGDKHNHTHHIKPKSIYPQLADDWRNKVEVPDIVHWALHQLLSRYAEESGGQKFKNIVHSDVASFINGKRGVEYDFCDSMLDEILEQCFSAAVICRKIGLLPGELDFDFIKKEDTFPEFAYSKINRKGEATITSFNFFDIMSLCDTYRFPIIEKTSHSCLTEEARQHLRELKLIKPITLEDALKKMRKIIAYELSDKLCGILCKYQKSDILDFTIDDVDEIIQFSK